MLREEAGRCEGGAARRALDAMRALPDFEGDLLRLRRAAHPLPREEKLPRNLLRQAMGPVRALSVTRLEQFAACPFRHFARYALRPEPFRAFELTPQDAGVFYHEAIEAFMRESDTRLALLSIDEASRRMDEVTGVLIDHVVESALGEGAARLAESVRLRDTARRAATTLVRQMRGSRFVPAAVEVAFGGGRPALRVAGDVALEGRIDRIDRLDENGARYLRVIDYKTGGKKLNLCETYYGLQLQLALYLAAAARPEGGAPPGMFYFSVADPIPMTDERDPERVEEERLLALRMDGVALDDPDVLHAMAERPELSIPVTVLANGSMKKSDKLLEKDDFEKLLGWALKKADEAARGILDGDVRALPYELSGRSACDHCEYQCVCQYDATLPGTQKRRLRPMRAREALDAMRLDPPEA